MTPATTAHTPRTHCCLPPQNPEPSATQRLVAFKEAFWKFLRPHTIRGTILGSSAVTAMALLENPAVSARRRLILPRRAACCLHPPPTTTHTHTPPPPASQLIDWALLPRALLGVAALLCGNGFIVGINQIYDVDIDAVNKPFLPVASGELSPALAWVLCLLLAAGARAAWQGACTRGGPCGSPTAHQCAPGKHHSPSRSHPTQAAWPSQPRSLVHSSPSSTPLDYSWAPSTACRRCASSALRSQRS